MIRRNLTATLLALASWGASALSGGCFFSPTDGDGDSDSDADADGDSDPDAGPVCPAEEPHLVLGLSPVAYDADSVVLRLDASLRPCRGVSLGGDYGSLTAVGGTSSGQELLGFAGGYLLLVEGELGIWEQEQGTYGNEAGAVFTIRFEGREVAAVLWVDSYQSGEVLELRELADGRLIESYPASFELVHAAPSILGEEDRVAGLLTGDGVQEYRANAGAESLGTMGERQIAAPYSGYLNWLSSAPGRTLIAADEGILYWVHDAPPAFLGPVACRWPAVVGGRAIDPEVSEEYLSVTHDRERDDRFLAVVEGQLVGADSRGSYLIRLSTRAECEVLATADEDHRLVALAWTGE